MSSWKRQRTDEGYQGRDGRDNYRGGPQGGLRIGAGGGAPRGPMMCYNCKQPGHHSRDCPQPRTGGDKRGGRGNQPVMDEKTKWELELKVVLVEKTAVTEDTKDALTGNLSTLSEALVQDLTDHHDAILNTLFLCVKSLPVQTPAFATLVGLMNLIQPTFGAEVVQRLASDLTAALATHEEVVARLLVRFLACLCNACVVHTKDFLTLCLDIIKHIPESNLSGRQADRLLNTVVTALIWIGMDVTETEDSYALEQLIESIEHCFATRVTKGSEVATAFHAVSTTAVPCLPVDACEIHQEDRFTELWAAFKTLREKQWQTELVLRPHVTFNDKLKEATKHKFHLLQIPNQAVDSPSSHWPDLHIFPKEEEEKNCGPVERSILMQHFSDIMFLYENVRKEGTKQLMSVSASFDCSPVLVETVFSHIFALPNSPVLPTYYGAVFVDLVKAKPKLFPPLVGKAINFMFQHLPQLDIECRDRLAELLSLHLSNFGYMWPWTSWAEVSSLAEAAPQRVMVEDSLEYCVRLAYWERISETLPDSVQPLMPHRPTPAFRWKPKAPPPEKKEGDTESKAAVEEDEDTTMYIQFAGQLIQMFKAKDSGDKVEEWLNSTVKPKLQAEGRLRLFAPTLLHAGSKSFTHITALLSRYKGTLTALTTDSDSQSALISLVSEFWQHSHQHIMIILDKLLLLNLVSSSAVVRWVFQQQSDLHRRWVWAILENAINKQTQRLQLAKEQQKKHSEVLGDDTKDLDKLTEGMENEKKELMMVVFQQFQTHLGRTADAEDIPMHEMLAGRFLHFCRKYVEDYRPWAKEVEESVLTAHADFDDALLHQFRLCVQY
eukprot:gb/GEZN01002062.1/.p1 GENE.gb/GEZN01002062.1/~~gb/GEZN01002062.1/.p1  ORF type:complete len:834 (+),score=143.93 gb/GEZN01002062.1/:59-2560(+)